MSPSVLYIAGLGRSGSTLLARLLGEVPGVFNAGECVRYLFTSHMFQRDLPCSCARAPLECEFWGPIAPLVSDMDRATATDILRIRNMYPWSSNDYRARVGPLRELIAELYRQVAFRCGADLIVDSSKHPGVAQLAASSDLTDLHVVHLVRDPRAVVASRRTAKAYLGALNPGLVVGRWLGFNIATELLSRTVSSYRRIRYEDFVDQPVTTLAEVLEGVTGRASELNFIDGHRAAVGPQHALAGNPDKFDEGSLVIRRDSKKLQPALSWGVTAATLPMLVRYKYPVRPERN